MLTDIEYKRWKQQVARSHETAAMIDLIRQSDPARRVTGRAGNVSARYPSRKMKFVIQAESHRVELAAIQWMEYDDEVLEYYDQPNKLELLYSTPSGKRVRVQHTPDFFVMRRNHAGWEEWKPEDKLYELAKRMPNRYERLDNRWRCIPGELAAKKFGLDYRVRTTAEINWIFQRNIQFLDDYLRQDEPPTNCELAKEVLGKKLRRGEQSLEHLLAECDSLQRDSIYWLIATNFVHVDLSAAPLTSPEKVRVFNTKKRQQRYSAAIKIQPREAETRVNEASNPYLTAGPTSLAQALSRYRAIESLLYSDEVTAQVAEQAISISERTLWRWKADYLKSKELFGDGLIGLLAKDSRRGNRSAKLPQHMRELMHHFIVNVYETNRQPTARVVYGKFVNECQQHGFEVPSYVTFMHAINMRPKHESALKRKGPRAAYTHTPFYWDLSPKTPRHGDRPFEIVHLDHTELDVELVCSQTQKRLGRPWATFMVDAYSRRLLAALVTYDRPSYRSCMAAMRDCVHRFGRLPQILVVDGGSEFRSVYFETLLAAYECTKKTRPSAQPRFGSVCERLFGTTNSMFIHNLRGNTQITRNVRQVTKCVNPKLHAVWTLSELQQTLTEWAYEIYDTLEHHTLGTTPRDAFERGLTNGGQRAFRRIEYDQNFVMATMPTTIRGKAMLRSDKGIQINNIQYWSDAFRDARFHRTNVPVRYDPFDVSVSFAYFDGRWVRCRSEHAIQFAGYSEQAIRLISDELHKRRQSAGAHYQITAARLAKFIEQSETSEALLAQRSRDSAQQEARSLKGYAISDRNITTAVPHLSKPTKDRGLRLPKANREELVVYGDY